MLVWVSASRAADDTAWFAFDPPQDSFGESPIDLRWLNEKQAGEHGFIAVQGDEFVHTANRQPVRFWGVNGLPAGLGTGDALAHTARRLAKHGVNLVRLHDPVFDRSGETDPGKIQRIQDAVEALKVEGIYSHFSIYFPLWMTPPADLAWLKGYNGKKHPFAALMFNPDFQERYREWWKALLLTPNPKTGRRLVDEPAVFGLEMQNEDSFFFWTFGDQIPEEQLRLLETQFGEWLKKKHGSLEAAFANWNGQTTNRDDLAEGRVGFRGLQVILNEKSARDRETTQFLFATQRKFYADTREFLRALGFKGLITASNWITASPEVFGPLEKLSYTVGDFIDRHGYFPVAHKGEHSEWSIRNGHTYADRSALRFDARAPGMPKQFVHPAMDPAYDGKPSMISETTWNRPNRFRGEAPLYLAAYGALQGSDAIVHFALDGRFWSVTSGMWMQPQTLMAPSQVAQFPAAALIYRRGMVKAGSVLAELDLSKQDLLNLKGTPLPQHANFEEMHAKEGSGGSEAQPRLRIDPLIHYAGRVNVRFTDAPGTTVLRDLRPFVDRIGQKVRSSTGELALDYGKGLLILDAPSAQGASGNLKVAGEIALGDVAIRSDLDNAHIVLVSLDGEPISRSKRMLLQAMSEEGPTDFAAEDAGGGVKRITNVGRDPWRVKALQGLVIFKRSGALRIQPLDFNGYPIGKASNGTELTLAPEIIYYLVTRRLESVSSP